MNKWLKVENKYTCFERDYKFSARVHLNEANYLKLFYNKLFLQIFITEKEEIFAWKLQE